MDLHLSIAIQRMNEVKVLTIIGGGSEPRESGPEQP